MEQIRKPSSVDAVTGLPSRALGEEFLRNKLSSGETPALFLIDLDQFKSVNERWGFGCGDQVLKEIASILAEHSNLFDLICRWEGDKYVLLPNPDCQNLEEVAAVLRRRLVGPYTVEVDERSMQIEVGVSVGLAQTSAGDTTEDLLQRAGEHLYMSRKHANYGQH